MTIGYGEYVLNRDPYNFETEEEYVKFYHPELLEEKEFENGKISEQIQKQRTENNND